MPEYKGTIKKWKSVGSIWDILYPKTTIDQVIDLSTTLANMQSDIDDISQSIPTIPSVMGTTEGNTGTATTQRTINAANLKAIILNHSPAGARPASDVYSWAKDSTKPAYSWSEIGSKPTFATVATSGSYDDLSNKPTIPNIPTILGTTEGNAGTATTQRTVSALNLKSIILYHSPAGSRPASDVYSWAKASAKPAYSFDELTPSSVVVKTTNYRPVLSDANKLLYVNSTSNLSIYIASTGTTVFPIGTEIHVLRYGTGEVTISPDSGVTLLSDTNKLKIGAQYGVVTVKKILTNTWVLFGSLKL